jgi:hypothetical protein
MTAPITPKNTAPPPAATAWEEYSDEFLEASNPVIAPALAPIAVASSVERT